MKFMKLALLGTAALAAVSVSARADDLADLKAQIEALKADVANLQAAPSVPAGYSLMTYGEAPAIVVPGFERDAMSYGPTAKTIGILPTADMPASTNLQWSGFVRAALVYTDVDNSATDDGAAIVATADGTAAITGALGDGDDALHILSRGELTVRGTNDTAVGEVGATMTFQANFDGVGDATVVMSNAWGWWRMTPELTLGAGGSVDSLATINHGGDNLTAMYSAGVPNPGGFGDTTQFQLQYASGPISAAISANHYTDGELHGINTTTTGSPSNPLVADGHNEFGMEAEIKYTGDTFSAELAGGVREDNWRVGVGATANLSDMFSVQVSAGMFSGDDYLWMAGANPAPGANNGATTGVITDGKVDGFVVSALVTAALSDAISLELGAGYSEYDGNSGPGNTAAFAYDGERLGVAGGLYYTPVSQLTIGVEASYNTMEEVDKTTPSSVESDSVAAALVTVFRF